MSSSAQRASIHLSDHVSVVGRDGVNLQDDHNQGELWTTLFSSVPHDLPAAESYMSLSVAGMPNYLMYGRPSYLAAHGSLRKLMPLQQPRIILTQSHYACSTVLVNELIANYICTMIYKWQLEPNLK
jgi:hypothetical protein